MAQSPWDVLFPYLNGEDLTTRPDQSPSRWVINFSAWPLDRVSSPIGYQGPVASDYPDCLAIIESKAKPERMKSNRKLYRDKWWQFAEKCPGLYGTIAGMKRVLVCAQTSKYLSISFQILGTVYSHTTVVFALDDYGSFALLNGTFHASWISQYCSSLETRLRYMPTDGFETFPFPATPRPSLTSLGEAYHNNRRQIMLARQEGLTKTYNRFHNPDEPASEIRTLRDLHVEMDRAVAAAYDWSDLDLGHCFHETKQGTRFTISEAARREVLARLLKLNHERYAEEVAHGLHGKSKGESPKAPRKPRKRAASEPSLFGEEDG